MVTTTQYHSGNTAAPPSRHIDDQDNDNDHYNTDSSSSRRSGSGSGGSNIHIMVVTPGEVITKDSRNVLRGHGTYVDPRTEYLHACVCGVVERVNKLVTVRPLRSRYNADIGDVVVGRVTEVGNNRWRVDVQGRQDAILLLSSVNLPGGVQRRKTYEDQLNMRQLYVENDLISAEVMSMFGSEGTISLQTRSARYGKLSGNGQFVRVNATLVKRCKQHFHTFPATVGVSIILGKNGYLWIYLSDTSEQQSGGSGDNESGQYQPFLASNIDADLHQRSGGDISVDQRRNMARIRNAILALQHQFLPIYPETIMDVYEQSKHLEVKNMLLDEYIPLITSSAAERVKEKSVLFHQHMTLTTGPDTTYSTVGDMSDSADFMS